MTTFALILPAAGSGTRLGSAVPKPFLEIAGRSILEVTISRFTACRELAQIVIPVARPWRERVEEILGRCFPHVPAHVVDGGAERQDSIRNALRQVDAAVPYVAVHDAVRPFVPSETVRRCLRAACEHGAAIVAVPAKDTIKRAGGTPEDPHVLDTPDRSDLWQAQTPQIFSTEILRTAYAQAAADGFTGTDDASLVERLGVNVRLVAGPRENLKITFPVDLRLAELLMREEAGA